MRTTQELRAASQLQGLRSVCIDDIDGLIALTEACREVDQIETIPNAEQMRRQFETPGLEITNNVFVLEGETGEIVGSVSAVPLPGADEYHIQMQVVVKPEYRSEGGNLEDLLAEFGLASATEWMARTGNKAAIQAGCWSYQQNSVDLITRHGFKPIRYFHTLERDLKQPIIPSPTPGGVRIRGVNLPEDAEKLYLALHESFQDHFNPMNFTLEQTMHWVTSPDFKLSLVLLAFGLDPETDIEAEPAGVCMNHIRNNYNLQHNTLEGEVGALGVRRAYRRRGLARAMLTQSLELLRNEGMRSAILSVDSENPLGATQLYGSVGFTLRKTAIVFQYS
jgi:mycothiol synthase